MNYDDLIDSLHIAEPTRELCIKAADAIQQMIIDRNAFKDIAQKRADVIERMQKELHEAKNELCCKCGKYREAHNGACDGCRWKEAALKGGESDA